MTTTLVLQSCPAAEAEGWLAGCMRSVRQWAEAAGHTWRWLDDALFDFLPAALRPGGRITPVIASDLARLAWAQQVLRSGEARQVLWLDADVLVFRPDALHLPEADHAVAREVWVQADGGGGWRAHRKVHNAALFFRADAGGRNTFLDFYTDTATRLLQRNTGGMPPQFIGPKLLTALHNVVQLPVMENIGMISPVLAADLLGAGNGALACYRRRNPVPLAAANLCRSSVSDRALGERDMPALMSRLASQPDPL